MTLTFKTTLIYLLIFFYLNLLHQSLSSSLSIKTLEFDKRTLNSSENLTSDRTDDHSNDYENLNQSINQTSTSTSTDLNESKSNQTSTINSIHFPGQEGKPECESGSERLIEHDCNRALLALGSGIAGKIKFLRVDNETATGTFKTCKITVQSLDGKPVHVSKGRLEHGPGYVDFMKICQGQPGTMILGGGQFGMTIESSECDGQ
ncbi:hypothetical protein DFH28DRAFT_527582 [Melampsora americana]|nr:hypothetical protein DFH28DRAFT_527582 [Melampsora americana]